MRKMKDSGVEWIGEIPVDWNIKKNKQLFVEVNDRCENGNEHILLSVSEYYGIAPKSEKTSYGEFETRAESLDGYKLCKVEDIVMNIMLAWKRSTGRSAYDGIVSPAYCVYRKKADIDTRYYHYLFRTDIVADLFKRYSTGIIDSRLRLYPDKFMSLNMIVPPCDEQRQIAEYLDQKCVYIDSIIEKTKVSIEEYKKLKQAIITQAITKGVRGNRPMKDSGIEWIGEIPAEWGIANIGRMCFVTKLAGFEFTNDMVANITDEGEVPIVRAQNIKMGRFLNSISEYISLQLSQKLNRCALDKKCLIITFIGAGIGEVAIFNEKKRYHLAPNVAKIVINDDKKQFISEEYLLYFLMSSAGQEEVNKIKKATAQPNLSMETIRALKCIIPRTICEQEEIVAILDQKCVEIDTLIAKKTALLEEMENYKKSVIYEYVTGKKEVKNH